MKLYWEDGYELVECNQRQILPADQFIDVWAKFGEYVMVEWGPDE